MSLKLKITLGMLLVFAGFLVTRVALVFNHNIRVASTTANISSSVNDKLFASEDPLTKDSDHDGSPDRDEVINATDPFNPDTDGDTYKDGEEISSGRDPLDPSSNSTTSDASTTLSSISSTANLTDRLMNLSFASLVNDTGNLDPDQITEGNLADIIADMDTQGALYFFVPPLNDSDIKIINDDSPDAVKKYLNSVAPLIEEGVFSSSSNLVSGIIGLSGSTGSNYNYYQRTYDSLKLISVPASWKELHKEVLLNFLKLSTAFAGLTDMAIENDPVKASFALSQVQNSFLIMGEILNKATRLANSQNVQIQDSLLTLLQSNGFLTNP